MCRRATFTFLALMSLLIITGSDADSLMNPVSKEKKQQMSMPMLMGMFNLAYLLENYQNFIEDFKASVPADEQHTCGRDMSILLAGIMNKDIWALKMIDSSSKIPSGLLEGNIIDLGMFDECMAAVGESKGYQIRGLHCMYSLDIPALSNLPMDFTLSSCLPSSCGPRNVVVILNLLIKHAEKIVGEKIGYPNGTGIRVKSATCAKIDQEVWTTELIVGVSVFGVYLIFLIFCTLCDLIITKTDEFQKHHTLVTLSKFSLTKNAARIFSIKITPNTLPSIHGIRFLSIAWVVLGHSYVIQLMAPNVNTLDFLKWVGSRESLFVFLAPFAVDTFFTLSGFLLAYIFLKQIPKQKSFNIPVFYLHRYLRLTPSVAVLLAFTIIALPKLASGPRWDITVDYVSRNCRSNWWSIILYSRNFLRTDTTCLQHLWYLDVDMQLFFISPIILYPLYKKPKIGIILAIVFCLASIAAGATITAINKYPIMSFSHLNEITTMTGIFQEVYTQTYCRAAPYFIGILLGYELAAYKRKLKKLVVWIGWSLTVVLFAFCAAGTRYFMRPEYEYNAFLEISFATISRPLWSLAVCWIIFASVYKCGGWISSFLDLKFFIPVSRLSYWIYLIHVLAIILQTATLRTSTFFSDYFVMDAFVSNLVVSIVLAFFFSLIFESPLLILEKMFLRRMKESQHESQKDLRLSSEEDISDKSGRITA